MSSLSMRQREIQMKRFEGKSRARQVALCLGLVRHKGKEFFEKRPIHVLGITMFGVIVLSQAKRLRVSVLGYRQVSLLLNILKK